MPCFQRKFRVIIKIRFETKKNLFLKKRILKTKQV